MGKHYVPQQYLRGFQGPNQPEMVWMYDKLRQARKLVRIKRVAQGDGFYTDEVEEALTEYVEKPANAVIAKLRRGAALGEEDRGYLAYYIGTMIRRVPHARDQAYRKLPEVLADTAREVREHFEAQARGGRLDAAALGPRLAETDAAERKLRQQPPPETVEWIETPWPTEWMLAALFGMTWRLLPSDGSSFFLTNDNPACFFECFGLGTDNAELIFPLCRDLALHCSWQGDGGTILLGTHQRLVHEFNRRIAALADRFIFYHEEKDWVLEVARNSVQQLNRILW
jgi:hypothetical protein